MLKRYLAIDYGTKRIGLALSKGSLAEPWQILPNDDQIFAQLKECCQQQKIDQIIVGLSEKEMAEKTKLFVKQLSTQLTLPVIFMDETLSSKQVQAKLIQAGAPLKKRQGPIDHYAAALILQNWLDENYVLN